MNNYTEKFISLTSGEALEQNRRVKLSSGTAVYADAGEAAIGVTMAECASGGMIVVKLWNDGGTFCITSAGTIAIDGDCYGADDGKISATITGPKIAVAAEALTASDNGQVIAIGADAIGVLQAGIADPGNAGAIPITRSGTVQLVTTGAATRTLAAPTFVGQQIGLNLQTDGGDCVITVAHVVDGTNKTITLDDEGDIVLLVGVGLSASKEWRLLENTGGTLST